MKNCLLLFFLSFSILSLAQNTQESVVPDERLFQVYEKEYIDGLVNENPFLIKRWNFYLDNAFYVTDEVIEKNNNFPTVVISNINTINILLLEKEHKIQKDWDKLMAYKIVGTDKLLVYYAGKDFTKSLKKYLEDN